MPEPKVGQDSPSIESSEATASPKPTPIGPSDDGIGGASAEDSEFQWPVSFMSRESFRKGEYLFKAGDRAEKIYFISKGLIRLPELDRSITGGQVLGELGIFSPGRQRTATALVEEDVEAYTMGGDEVRQLMSRDPGLAINLIQVSIKRLIEHIKVETQARERINAELRIAHDIQSSMLPRTFPPFPGRKEFEIFAMMEPANEVGGDFYDYFLAGEDRLCVLVGDVSGKGVPAALLMALSKTLLRSEAMRGYPAAEVLTRVNNLLCPETHDCMFVTVFCLILNTRTGEAECCTAGHNPPLLCSSDGGVEFLNLSVGLMIGFQENLSYKSTSIKLKPGDMLLLYTDGVTEAENSKQEFFTQDRFKSCVAALRGRDLREIIDGVRQDIAVHVQGHRQSDDITLLALKYNGTQCH